ncbi:MAG: M23 family metallopeptidase [Gammaproteobacteria bacterium]|nr:M23 family metallopeptidase [Gammaproteobacteria bacterium]
MAFVILSAGNLAASRVRTVTTRRIALGVGMLLLVTLASGIAGGLALGYRLADRGDGKAPLAAPDVGSGGARLGNQALIDRIGTLSARLLRLESEALTLAKRVGLANEVGQQLQPATGDGESDPSGGPLLEADDAPEASLQPDIRGRLARLESTVDSLDASLALVSRRTAASDLAEMAYPRRYPIPGARISSGFGNRRDPFTRHLARHTGVDMPAPWGTPVLASAGGTVSFAGYRRAYGNAVEIDHGDGLVTRYAHASKVLVRKGQVVLPEQPIAAVGSSGRSTGPHLHFEVLRQGRPVEPLRYLEQPGP